MDPLLAGSPASGVGTLRSSSSLLTTGSLAFLLFNGQTDPSSDASVIMQFSATLGSFSMEGDAVQVSSLEDLRREMALSERIHAALSDLQGSAPGALWTYHDTIMTLNTPRASAAVPLHAVRRHAVHTLTAARTALVEDLLECEAWFRVMRAINPEAETFVVPERFCVIDDIAPAPAFTAEDLDASIEVQELLARG